MTMHIRAATLRPATLNTEARTVEAIASTGAEVARPGFTERLDLSRADLSRLIGGPVLDGHRRETTRDQLGVIEAAEIRAEGLWVRIRFRQTAAALAVMTDVADGTLRGLSIGYSVEQWADAQDGKRRIRTATQWTPQEVSLVPVPADPGAHFRHEVDMETTTTTAPAQTRAQINAEIRSVARLAHLPPTWADAQIDAEVTADEARAAAFAELARAGGQTRTRTATATIGTDNTDPAVIASRAGEAIFARSHPEHQLSPEARQFMATSLAGVASESLRRTGASVHGLSVDTLVTRAMHTTSDFPLILGDAVGRELRRAYTLSIGQVRQLARQTTARDFRAKRAIMMGEAADLELVGEAGEFKYGTIAESAESYSVATFGKIFAISRQALVNDDLGAFTQIPSRMGASAAAFEAAQLVAKIEANPNMSDGVAVFHSTRGNLSGTAAEPSAATLSAARLSMRKKKGLSGAVIDVTPKFVLVPPEYETVAEQALSNIAAAKTSDANPFTGLTLVTEPRLTSGTRWYVAADPAAFDGLEYAYLEGAPGPQIETRTGFEVDGVQMKVRLDFGCGWIDHRGWYRNG